MGQALRYKIIENEEIGLTAYTDNNSRRIVKSTSAVVFNSKLQILPLVSAWLTESLLGGKISLGTIETYAKNFSYLLDYIEKHSIYKNLRLDEALLDVQKHTFEEYFSYLKSDKCLASTTIRNRDASYKAFYVEYLCKARENGKAIRSTNPYEDGLISAKSKSKLVEMCSIDELTALLKCAHNERERVLVQFIYDTGLRRKEVTKILKTHIDVALNSESYTLILDDETMLIPSDYKALYVKGVKGRNKEVKERYTLPTYFTLARVKRYFSTPEYRKLSKKYGVNAPAFINSKGSAYSVNLITKLLYKLSKRAVKKKLISRLIHPHMLRHGFAGSVLRSPDLGEHSVDKLVLLQRCLGHVFLETTQLYTSLPYDIYGKICNSDGEVLTRSQIIQQLNNNTKLRAIGG